MLHTLYCQHHACWCPSDLRSQGISRHGIDHISRNIPSVASEELKFICVIHNSLILEHHSALEIHSYGKQKYHYLMPRSQPAVRATALVCLVLQRSYVSNSASPVADWGLKVILQPPYRQRTSLAAAMPPTRWIARRKSHSEGTFNVLSPCLRGTFNVPPATCLYGGVRVCTSVAQHRCVEGTTHVRRTHGHILPAQSRWADRFPPRLFGTLTLHFGPISSLSWR